MIRHLVLFSAKDKADIPKIQQGLETLATIPSVNFLEVKQNLKQDSLSQEFDVVLYAEFKDKSALNDYKSHSIYQNCIDIVRPLRDRRVVVDF